MLLPFVDDGNEDSDACETRGIFLLIDNASCVDFFFLFLSHKGVCVISEEHQCDIEESPDRQARKMAKERLVFPKPNHTDRPSAGERVGQSSHDTWKSSQPQGKWKEISVEMDALGSTLKEKTNTWNSCKDSAKRESE